MDPRAEPGGDDRKQGVRAMELKRQHLIDPVVCIRCNTCEETCPQDAITHDSNNRQI